MSFADVTKPVIIQASKTIQPKIDNYLRRMCIVSAGGSSLSIGESKVVRNSNYKDYLNSQVGSENNTQDLEKKIKGFFSFAGDKELCILEVGAFNKENNTIKNQVGVLRDFINSHNNRSYCHLVPKEWYYPQEQTASVENSVIVLNASGVYLMQRTPDNETLPQDVTFTQSEKEISINTNIPYNNLSLSVSNPNVAVAELNDDATLITIRAVGAGEATLTISGRVNIGEGNDATLIIPIRVGAWNENLTLTQDEQTKEQTPASVETDNGVKNVGRDLAFSELTSEFISLESKVFFFITLPANEDPSVSPALELYKNKKSVFLVYDNLKNSSFYLDSIILGIVASGRYDLGDNQKGTPLNFKTLDGQNVASLSNAFSQSVINLPATFGGTLAGVNVILNGRYADGIAWEYYYFWDTVEFEIKKKLETILLNGVNSSQAVIPYNQAGLDILQANIKSVLLLWQNRGVITSFSKTYDNNLNSMVGVGDINAVDFETYIRNNAEDYANEIYKGFSFYLMIGRFIRQIYVDVTLS